MNSDKEQALPLGGATQNAWLDALTPEVYRAFQQAVAVRRWPNGQALTEAQLQTCLQAMIVYEHQYLPPEQRTGYVPPKVTPCDDTAHDAAADPVEAPIRWRDA